MDISRIVAVSASVVACGSARPVAAPPPKPLTAAEVDQAIAPERKIIKHECWDATVVTAPAAARVVTQFTVRSDGTVASVTATDPPQQLPNLSGCIVNRLRTLSFRPSGEEGKFTMLFEFGAH